MLGRESRLELGRGCFQVCVCFVSIVKVLDVECYSSRSGCRCMYCLISRRTHLDDKDILVRKCFQFKHKAASLTMQQIALPNSRRDSILSQTATHTNPIQIIIETEDHPWWALNVLKLDASPCKHRCTSPATGLQI
jgi:hypothetical protein